MLENFSVATFSSLVGSLFAMYVAPTSALDLELLQAHAADKTHDGRPFSLVFRGPRTPVMAQRIYPLEHETLGHFELFLVPIGPDEHGMLYEAIFT